MQKLFYTLLILIACSCTSYPEAIEDVLRQAGDNRGELEKVLKHYSRDPADSLKLRAAEFLIVNMPGKYSEICPPWDHFEAAFRRWDKTSGKQVSIQAYGLDQVEIEDDVTHITAQYLIDNIESAFEMWRQRPWGKHISFDIFCEEILPYRLHTEPLENWREKALASFADLDKMFREQTDITAVQACRITNLQLVRSRQWPSIGLPAMNFTMLMASSKGTCSELSAVAVFTMRALGIPVTQDYTPLWPNRNVGHSWNTVCDSSGLHISFMGTEAAPGERHQGTTNTKNKVYRYTFAKQNHIKTELPDIPPMLQYPDIVDVTSEYDGSIDINIPILHQPEVETGYAYLAIPYETMWNPVCWGITGQKDIKFSSVGKKVLYMPVYYSQHNQRPANYPFWLDEEGSCKFLRPDSSQKESLALSRVNSSNDPWVGRMLHGRFEGATRSDFSDAKLLYSINELQGAFFHSADLLNVPKYRFIRYLSPEKGNCNVAELEFYDTSNNKLHGTVIGTPGAWGNTKMTCDKVFDGDVTTYFDATTSSNAWVGLDFGEPVAISKICFLPRTDGNSVYEGHTYELFYWGGQQWYSLGKQVAMSHQLYYQAPSNALFFLQNVTTKKIGYFTIQDGVQKWL